MFIACVFLLNIHHDVFIFYPHLCYVLINGMNLFWTIARFSISLLQAANFRNELSVMAWCSRVFSVDV